MKFFHSIPRLQLTRSKRQLCVFGCTAGCHWAIRDQGMQQPAASGFTFRSESCVGKEKAGTNTPKDRLSFRMLVPAKLAWFGSCGAGRIRKCVPRLGALLNGFLRWNWMLVQICAATCWEKPLHRRHPFSLEGLTHPLVSLLVARAEYGAWACKSF